MAGISLMIANYFHDLAVAVLVTNVLAIYFVGRHFDRHPRQDEVVAALFTKLSRVTYSALAYVVAAGAVRAYFFMDFEWNPAVGRGQVAALVVKHVLLVTLTVLGLLVQNRYRRKYGTHG
jgi:uncharacterized membrane protein